MLVASPGPPTAPTTRGASTQRHRARPQRGSESRHRPPRGRAWRALCSVRRADRGSGHWQLVPCPVPPPQDPALAGASAPRGGLSSPHSHAQCLPSCHGAQHRGAGTASGTHALCLRAMGCLCHPLVWGARPVGDGRACGTPPACLLQKSSWFVRSSPSGAGGGRGVCVVGDTGRQWQGKRAQTLRPHGGHRSLLSPQLQGQQPWLGAG